MLRLLAVMAVLAAVSTPSAAETHGLAAESSRIEDPGDFMPPGKRYARVTNRAPVYATQEDIREDRVSSWHGRADAEVWVVVHDRAEVDGGPYYLAGWDWNKEGWIAKEKLSFSLPASRLRGIDLSDRDDERLAMVHVDRAPVYESPPDDSELGSLGRYDLVTVKEKTEMADKRWYRIASDQWLNSDHVRSLAPGTRPESVEADERWIEVNLSEQTLFAHEGDTPVFATLVSSGREGRETITGLFRPWIAFRSAPMRGYSFGLQYDLAHVPWIVYFEGAFAWHGTYWHDRFGTRRSAGCINLSPHDAHWLITWAEPSLDGAAVVEPDDEQPGTWVYIHERDIGFISGG